MTGKKWAKVVSAVIFFIGIAMISKRYGLFLALAITLVSVADNLRRLADKEE